MSIEPVRYLALEKWVLVAARVLATDESVVRRVAKVGLAESALASPAAGFGATDVHPSLADKAAVLCHRLVKNHPLPDGNKRTAFVSMVMFLELNGCSWTKPDVDDAVEVMIRVASDELTIEELAEWIRRHIDRRED